MPGLPTRFAVAAVVAVATISGLVAWPAVPTYRGLSRGGASVDFFDVLGQQLSLQLDASRAGIRLEVRDVDSWAVGDSFLEMLHVDERGSGLTLQVHCVGDVRTIHFAKARLRGSTAAALGRHDVYAEVLQGAPRSAWILSAQGARKSFYGVRQLPDAGWSYRDVAPTEDASVSLAKAYPDMGLRCTSAPPPVGSFARALALAGPTRFDAANLGTADAPKGLLAFSALFGKLGSVDVVRDAASPTASLAFTYEYGADAAQAGAAFLRARAALGAQFAQTAHHYERNGVQGELTRNLYALDLNSNLALELTKTADGAWHTRYVLTTPRSATASVPRATQAPTASPEQPVSAAQAASSVLPSAPAVSSDAREL